MYSVVPANLRRLAIVAVILSLGGSQILAQHEDLDADRAAASSSQTALEATASSEAVPSPWKMETTVGQIVADRNATAHIFELVGIDYCCGGQQSLDEAAKKHHLDANQLLRALMAVGTTSSPTAAKDWQSASLDDLMSHIVETHHAWLRREIPRLVTTTQIVHQVHGKSHPELSEIENTLLEINQVVFPHLQEEEQTSFPAIRRLAHGDVPAKMNEILDAMRSDHEILGNNLHRLRKLTDGYTLPEDACTKYREMLTGLEALERDMLQHVHLENNILLPRAKALLDQ